MNDPFAWVLLVVITVAIGKAMSSETVRLWSWRLAAAAWILYSLWAGGGSHSVNGWITACLWGLAVGGIVLGIGLISLSVLSFIWQVTPRFAAMQTRSKAPEVLPPPASIAAPIVQASAVPDAERERASEQAARVEQERKDRIDEARNEVIQFYDEHEALLADLPRALFRSQLQNQFPAGIAPEQAWQAAQQMISVMLPLVEKGRDRKRAEQNDQRKRARRAQRIQGQINKLADRIDRLSRSTVGDREIVGQEVQAIQEEIRKLETDRRAMESGEDGGMP